jgi:hypothetical protein
VLSAEPVPIYAGVSVQILSGADTAATVQGVQQALASYLWPLPPGGPDGGGWPIGRTVAADELLTQAARVPGVLAADRVDLYARSGSAWTLMSSVPLKPWQVAALQGVAVGTPPPAPPADAPGGGTKGPNLVPIVPNVC